MRPAAGDADLLARAARRCAALAAQLYVVESSLDAAGGGHSMRWSGTGAAMFRARAGDHRRSVTDTRHAVEHLAVLTRAFAHAVADAQARARAADHAGDPARAVDDELATARDRFRHGVSSVESALIRTRLRLLVPPGRWNGPVRPPEGITRPRLPLPPGRWNGPVRPPEGITRHRLPLPPPGRWNGPVRPPEGVTRHRFPAPTAAAAPPRPRAVPAPVAGATS